jgi:3-methyladenine DNA glycosylase/8-oxoguanine DNA glycosylase
VRWGPTSFPTRRSWRAYWPSPGVGPYAAAHVMMLVGRYSHLILDSWTRPTYARLNGGRAVKDATIERRFRRYGRYAGLAFWLYLTRDWA